MVVTFVLLTFGAIFSASGSPILDNSGFRDVLVAISDDTKEEDGPALIQSIKDLMTETSDMLYFASMTRFYIKDVTILTPKSWDIPEVEGEARHGEVYEHADIKIAAMDTEHGDAPYTHQPGRCGEEGNPILISAKYLLDLKNHRDEMVVKYGPIGKVLTQEFTKYRYGYFEEYGYPGTEENGEKYPSTYTQAYYDQVDRVWKMAQFNNYCADTKLDGILKRIEGESELSHIETGCDIDDETGEITTDSCFFKAETQNTGVSSMGSYQYTDLVSVFCDDDEYFPHNNHTRNKHNDKCLDETRGWEPMSTWTTILRHTDFENGHNGGIYVDSTVPEFRVASTPSAKFVLVVDNSDSMNSCHRFENLKTTLKRWVDNLALKTKVAIVKFGTNHVCATGSETITKDCYIEIKSDDDIIKLRTAIDKMSDMGSTHMSEALISAQVIMEEEHIESQGQPGVVMLVTDGMANGPIAIDDPSVWKPFQMKHIKVITLNLGAKIDTKLKILVDETKGKAFVSKDCSGIEDGAFQYASETFIPGDVGDKYFKSQRTSEGTVTGPQMVHTCEVDGQRCFKHNFTIEQSLNKEVNIHMRLIKQGAEVNAKEFIEDVSVRITNKANINQTKLMKFPEVEGFSLSFDASYKNMADFSAKEVGEEATEKILEVYLMAPKGESVQDFMYTTVFFETFAKKNFDMDEPADYYITCDHPNIIEKDKEFLITSQVLRGSTPIDHANVVARVHVSRESDPDALAPPLYFELTDDGKEGDEHENDGTYTTRLTPQELHLEDGTGISVMCNLVESPGAVWNDNNFYGKKKSVPTQNDQGTPYCCGTKDQKWNIPRAKDVTKLLRSSIATGAFVDPLMHEKDADFGPPARIVDLKAEKIGRPEEGLVKLSWTATGDDWESGTAQSYNLVYSDRRKGLMNSNGVTKDSRILMGGSMEPVSAGEMMEVIIQLENHHVPGTYMFALNATDDAGKVSRPSNIARINFHDGSPVIRDVDPHVLHGHGKNHLPFEEKIRRIVKDERIVTRFMALIEKNKKIVRDAEDNVMEKRLKEKMGARRVSVERLMDKIKKDDVLRAIYKRKLL